MCSHICPKILIKNLDFPGEWKRTNLYVNLYVNQINSLSLEHIILNLQLKQQMMVFDMSHLQHQKSCLRDNKFNIHSSTSCVHGKLHPTPLGTATLASRIHSRRGSIINQKLTQTIGKTPVGERGGLPTVITIIPELSTCNWFPFND